MNWYDIEDVLYDGSEKEILNLRCPDCNNLIHHHYDKNSNSLNYGCNSCGISMRGYNSSSKPNCAQYE